MHEGKNRSSRADAERQRQHRGDRERWGQSQASERVSRVPQQSFNERFPASRADDRKPQVGEPMLFRSPVLGSDNDHGIWCGGSGFPNRHRPEWLSRIRSRVHLVQTERPRTKTYAVLLPPAFSCLRIPFSIKS